MKEFRLACAKIGRHGKAGATKKFSLTRDRTFWGNMAKDEGPEGK